MINPRLSVVPDNGAICSFVPMEAIDDEMGEIVQLQQRHLSEVATGYTPFQDQDVLFAKITPCMENGKCAIASNLDSGIGFGSTEFHVIRAGTSVLPE